MLWSVLAIEAGSAVADGDPVKVLLIGDSLSNPVPGRHTEANVRIYAVTLAERLGSGYEIVNVARPGSSAFQWVHDLFEKWAVPERPVEIVILLIGSNDAAGFQPDSMPARRFEGVIRTLARLSLALGAETVVLVPAPQQGGLGRRIDLNIRLGRYRDAIMRVCESSRGVVCGPDLYMMLARNEHLENDRIHLNQKGHDAVAGLMYRALIELEETKSSQAKPD